MLKVSSCQRLDLGHSVIMENTLETTTHKTVVFL